MSSVTTEIDAERLEAFVGQAVADLAAANAGVMVSIGHKLGLFRAMAGAGSLTSGEVAERVGCAERYVREWLNGQVAGGYVEHDGDAGTYALPDEHAAVLSDEDSPTFLPPGYDMTASMWAEQERTIQAFRTGTGIPWGEHQERLLCGVAAVYRNGYRAYLVDAWLPALEAVVPKLEAGAHVADMGCGHGHSTILMAQAFPRSRFVGFDTHAASIAEARCNAELAGVADRVAFHVGAADGHAGGTFDLTCFFDCLHDLGDPVGAAARAREALADDGTVMLVEPYAGDRVEDNVGPVARLYYAGSATLCCAHALSEDGGYALGAQAGERALGGVFAAAGFRTFRRAAETPLNLVFEAKP